MSDETKPGAADPELENITLRALLKDAEARETALRSELDGLKDAARRRLEEPGRIHPDDWRGQPIDERVETGRKIAKGEVRVDPAAPRAKPTVRYMTERQLADLPLDERHAAMMGIVRGTVKIV